MFPTEVKLSVRTAIWLQPCEMRIVMSTKTRKISFDGQVKFHDISHKNGTFWASYNVIHIKWMLTIEWIGYIAASSFDYSTIIENVHVQPVG